MSEISSLATALAWRAPEPHKRIMGLMFERDFTPTRTVAMGFVRIPVGEGQPKFSVHDGCEEIYLVARGTARFYLGDEIFDLAADSAVYVAPGTPHRAENAGEDELLLYFFDSPSVFGPIGGYRQFMSGWALVQGQEAGGTEAESDSNA